MVEMADLKKKEELRRSVLRRLRDSKGEMLYDDLRIGNVTGDLLVEMIKSKLIQPTAWGDNARLKITDKGKKAIK